jgi:hypothetical protein
MWASKVIQFKIRIVQKQKKSKLKLNLRITRRVWKIIIEKINKSQVGNHQIKK